MGKKKQQANKPVSSPAKSGTAKAASVTSPPPKGAATKSPASLAPSPAAEAKVERQHVPPASPAAISPSFEEPKIVRSMTEYAESLNAPRDDKHPVVRKFEENVQKQPEIAIAVAAIQALTDVVKHSKATTMMGLEIELKDATDQLKACNKHSISLAAGCELFNRYVTRTSLEIGEFYQCKARLIERGDHFAEMSLTSRKKISEFGDRFIRDGKVVLVHGYSRVVISVLIHAAKRGKYFSVIVTEGRPSSAGSLVADELIKAGIPVTIVLDSAVGYVMEKVDLVLCGAEGVVESGGIINQIGTYGIALIAKALQTPFYVAAESYKFARMFPLTQKDARVAKEVQQPLTSCNPDRPFPPQAGVDNPRCDYTPPQFITLLFTDLGILTPSAVSDELIKLYY